MKIRGEYWITDHGVWFADGDIGDYNHEMYVIEEAKRRFLEAIGANDDIENAPFEDQLNEWATEEGIPQNPSFKTLLAHLANEKTKEELEELAKLLRIANNNGDAREYAVRHWGWGWVKQHAVGVHHWDTDTQNRIYRGFNEILDQEGWDDPDANPEITITCQNNGKHATVRLSDLKSTETITLEVPLPEGAAIARGQLRNQDVAQQPTYYGKHLGD